jgi:hypothetical protein
MRARKEILRVILDLRFTIILVKWSPGSYQTNNYTIDNLLFFAKHEELKHKSKDWLPRNRDNVCAWSDISACGLLFQSCGKIQIQLSSLA